MLCTKLLRNAAQATFVRCELSGIRASSGVTSGSGQKRRSSFCPPSPNTSTSGASCSSTDTTTQSTSPHQPSLAKKATIDVSTCGFPKQLIGGPSTVLDTNVFGEDAMFVANYKSTHVAGVADGVGGWKRYNIDSSKFSSTLMRLCSEIVQEGSFEPDRPDLIIEKAFKNLNITRPKPLGSSTACVLVVHQPHGGPVALYSANLGDSGFLLLRDGAVVYRSTEQNHYFNAPFQLTVLPEKLGLEGVIMDGPEKAEVSKIELQPGDVILLATDGLWDNVPESLIVEVLSGTKKESLQAAANSLALIARRLSHDEEYASPFAVKAEKHGISTVGGKPDDLVLILLHVS